MKKRLVGFTISAVAVVIVAVASFVSFKVYNANAEADKAVAAKVNGEVILVGDIRQSYIDNPQIQAQVPFEQFYDRTLEVFVNSKLVYQAASQANVEELPEYKRQFITAKEDLARKIYLENKVAQLVTEEKIAKLYDEYKTNFESQKEVKAKHILVEDENTAKEVIAKLEKGEDFLKLAEAYSSDQAELGYFTKEMMVPEFSAAAFVMDKGAFSKEPVKTQFGYHVILVDDVRASQPLELSAVEAKLKNVLTQQVVGEVFETLNSNAKIEMYGLDGKAISPK